tara:strand:- start:68 stop:985 length:918 start_codon:yes stop_codon:yes gene_type:complete
MLLKIIRSFFKKDGTAQAIAMHRLIETLAKENKRVISDSYANNFVFGGSIFKMVGYKLNTFILKCIIPGLHEHLIARTKYLDEIVKKNIKNGIKQYVILAAGYDSRANRLKLPSDVNIFELDQSAVQKKKLAALDKIIPRSKKITYIAINFSKESITNKLSNSGFDSKKNTIFTLEGLSQYITKDAFSSTLKEISDLTKKTKTTIFFSYTDIVINQSPQHLFGKDYPNPKKIINRIKKIVNYLGEPWISFYSKNEIEKLLLKNGFKLKEIKNLENLNDKYFASINKPIKEKNIFNLENFVLAQNF